MKLIAATLTALVVLYWVLRGHDDRPFAKPPLDGEPEWGFGL